MIRIPNGKIAVESLKTLSVEKVGAKGFITAKQKNELIALKVVYAAAVSWQHQDAVFQSGGTVYVRGDYTSAPAMHEKFLLGGVEVSIIPVSAIQAYAEPESDNIERVAFFVGTDTQPYRVPKPLLTGVLPGPSWPEREPTLEELADPAKGRRGGNSAP